MQYMQSVGAGAGLDFRHGGSGAMMYWPPMPGMHNFNPSAGFGTGGRESRQLTYAPPLHYMQNFNPSAGFGAGGLARQG